MLAVKAADKEAWGWQIEEEKRNEKAEISLFVKVFEMENQHFQ